MTQTRTLRKSSLRKATKNPPTETDTRPPCNKALRSRASRVRNQSQETLTQIDFVRISRFDRDEDSHDDEDDEFVLQNSSKRKRKGPTRPSKRQQTLTQIDWTPRIVSNDDEEDPESLEDDVPIQSTLGQDSDQPDRFQQDTFEASGSTETTQDTTMRAAHSMDQDTAPSHRTSGGGSELFEQPAAQDPTTPKTIRVLEVPSSQTPAPTPLSTQSGPRSRTHFQRSVTRSPLKEIGSNIAPSNIRLPKDNSTRKPSSLPSTNEISATHASQRNNAILTTQVIDDSEADSDEENEESNSSSRPLEAQDLGIRKLNFAKDQSPELSRLRTDSEEASSQLNREMFHFTQQQCRKQEPAQNDADFNMEAQVIPITRENEVENDGAPHQDLRPSQISTVDVTQDPSSSPSRRLASLPPFDFSSPLQPVSRESSTDAPSSPNIPRSRLTQQGTVTLSQLLPESLMNFSLPPPPNL